jgi:hypothetical protein
MDPGLGLSGRAVVWLARDQGQGSIHTIAKKRKRKEKKTTTTTQHDHK